MLFNTLDFFIFFILVLTAVAIIRQRRFQHLFFNCSEFTFFFYFSSNYLLSLLIASTILDFLHSKGNLEHKKISKEKKILLSISLAGNLGLLGFFQVC